MQKSTGHSIPKGKKTEKKQYRYDDEVEKQLKELLGKLRGKSRENSFDSFKEMNASHKKNYTARVKQIKAREKEKSSIPVKPQNLSPIPPKHKYHSPYSKTNLGMGTEKNLLEKPKPKPKQEKLVKLPSLFLTKPEKELKAVGPLYKIKWFAPDSNFKGKSLELTFQEVLGKGAFATVYEAIDSQAGRSVAVKVFDKRMLKDQSKRKEVQNELDLISKLEHPSIIKLIRTVEDSDKVYIVMENWGKDNLDSYIEAEKLPRSQLFSIFSQLVEAVQYLHAHNVFHRDIKLTNIMIKDGKICLLDFGLSSNSNYTKEFLYCGTPVYMAPEMNNRQGYEGAPVDVWCIGVCIFKALTGKYPFGGRRV